MHDFQQGLRELLAELEYNADLVDVPMTWMVETHQHNPLYSLFGITGEQIYNWGLLQGPQSAWTITFCTSWAQYIALTLDGIAGWFGDRIGRDYGDETGKTCEKLWRAYKPDLVRFF